MKNFKDNWIPEIVPHFLPRFDVVYVRRACVKSVVHAFIAIGLVFQAHAYKEDPHEKFPTSKNNTLKSTITWTPVDNVQKRCEAESHKRGFGGFNYPVEACSFWASNTCQIVTAKFVNFHTLGHEVRHCFQGEFHAH